MAREAGPALTARRDRADEHAIADRIPDDARPDLLDHTDGLVTHDQAGPHGILAAKDVEIGTADRRERDANHGFPDTGPRPRHLLDAEVTHTTEDGRILGDPTEVALLLAAREAGLDKGTLESDYPRVAEIPFDAARRCMTTVHRDPGGGFVSFTKGALEVMLAKSTSVSAASTSVALPADEIGHTGERMAADGHRVLALAMRRWPSCPRFVTPDAVEHDLTLLGLVGITDPPRSEARTAIAVCRAAGIVPVMITGDHPVTARAIATRVGLLDDAGDILTGAELDRLRPAELAERVGRVRVYARVSPEQKVDIVQALQARGEIVAMTGDGVNDAPALEQADIGVAMGVAGTDVAKEASAMLLLDDDFATIVRAVREGRVHLRQPPPLHQIRRDDELGGGIAHSPGSGARDADAAPAHPDSLDQPRVGRAAWARARRGARGAERHAASAAASGREHVRARTRHPCRLGQHPDGHARYRDGGLGDPHRHGRMADGHRRRSGPHRSDAAASGEPPASRPSSPWHPRPECSRDRQLRAGGGGTRRPPPRPTSSWQLNTASVVPLSARRMSSQLVLLGNARPVPSHA